MLSRRTIRGPATAVFHMPVCTVVPRQGTSRGRPMFTASNRATQTLRFIGISICRSAHEVAARCDRDWRCHTSPVAFRTPIEHILTTWNRGDTVMASLARLVLALALVVGPAPLVAQSHGGSHSHSRQHSGVHSYAPRSYSRHHSSAAVGPRDSHGRLKRSAEAKRSFERESG